MGKLTTLLSKPREVHALLHGFFCGYYGRGKQPQYADSKKEPHYFRAGYLAGETIRQGPPDESE